MKNMPDDNSIDTALLAAQLTETLEANGIDAMFQKLEDSLRHSRRWHSLFDAHLLRARATLGLPLIGPVTDADKAIKKNLMRKQLLRVKKLAGNSLVKDRLLLGGCICEQRSKHMRS